MSIDNMAIGSLNFPEMKIFTGEKRLNDSKILNDYRNI